MENGEEGNIYTIFTNSSKEYVGNFEIIKGELIFNSLDKEQLEIARDMGISINPYKIENGELLSADTNLMLMDEKTGTLTIPDSITSIGDGAFANVTDLRKVIIPGTVKRIGATAFANNSSLEEVVILDGVEELAQKAFYGCSNLEKITLPNSITIIGTGCFTNNRSLDNIKLPDNLVELSTQTFIGCTNLKNIELSKNMQTIGPEAFFGTKISSIKFPKELNKINPRGLSIPTLKDIDTSENNYYEFKEGVLYNKNLTRLIMALPNVTNINIENTVTTIQGAAFEVCSKLTTVNIPENVNKIENLAFSNANLSKITVDANNTAFTTDDKNNLYSKDGKILYRNFDIGDVTVKDGVENVTRGTFVDNGSIKTITLPESYTGSSISWIAFPKIEYLYLPKNVKTFRKDMYYQVKSIEVSLDNPNLKSINNEYILSKDGSELYWVKSDLANVQIPETVKTIKIYALMYSTTKNLILPKEVTNIEQGILHNAQVEKLEIGEKIQTIDTEAFINANNLREVIINRKNDGILKGSPWGNPYGARAIIWKK